MSSQSGKHDVNTGQDDLERQLAAVTAERDRYAKQLQALRAGAESILGNASFSESARAIFDYCRQITGATSGYVALLSDGGSRNELLFLESGGLHCNVDPDLPMPIRGLRAKAYQSGKPVYHNDFMGSEWAEMMPQGHIVLKNVLFAPLVTKGEAVGIIGLANKTDGFDEADAAVAGGFGQLAAIALQNSKDLEARDRAEAELNRLATTDSLTGLTNRRVFFQVGQEEVQRCKRYDRDLSCLMLDIDHFKSINDSHGHAFGDEVLKSLANCVKQTIREQDVATRIGGEEFGLLAPETGVDRATHLAERLLAEIQAIELDASGESIHFSVSIGVSERQTDEDDFSEVLRRADRALYQAKDAGRAIVRVNRAGEQPA